MMYRYRKYSTIIESVILLQLCSLARLLGGVLKVLDSCVAVLPDTSSRLRDRATCLLQRAGTSLQNVDTDTVSIQSLYSLYFPT